MGSFEIFLNRWKAGRESKILVIKFLLGRLPRISFPIPYKKKDGTWLWGEKAYLAYSERFGQETWLSPHNLWRVPFHFGMGLGIAGPLAFFLPGLALIGFVFGLALDQEWHDYKRVGFHFKNIMDIVDRTSGAIVGVLLVA